MNDKEKLEAIREDLESLKEEINLIWQGSNPGTSEHRSIMNILKSASWIYIKHFNEDKEG